VWRNFSGAMQVNREQTDRLGLLTLLGSLRMRISNHTRFHPYFQIAPASFPQATTP
jgi:hypothetical protein